MTDSRITWGAATEHWDAGRKTFASPTGADIFGYCGDAYFIPTTLGQVLSIAAAEVVDLSTPSAKERHDTVLSLLAKPLSMIRTKQVLPMTLFHGARDREFMLSQFRLWRRQFDPKTMSWSDSELAVDDKSYLAAVDGSGAASVRKFEKKVGLTQAGGTSRAAVHAFCSSLHSSTDPFSGGAPQVVGLWRKGLARQFGVCWEGKFFIAGMQVKDDVDRSKVDWFNHLFERCDARTGRRIIRSPSHGLTLRNPAVARK